MLIKAQQFSELKPYCFDIMYKFDSAIFRKHGHFSCRRSSLAYEELLKFYIDFTGHKAFQTFSSSPGTQTIEK